MGESSKAVRTPLCKTKQHNKHKYAPRNGDAGKYGAQLVGAHGLQYFVEKIKHSQDYFFGLSTIKSAEPIHYQSFIIHVSLRFHNLTIGYDKSVGYTYNTIGLSSNTGSWVTITVVIPRCWS